MSFRSKHLMRDCFNMCEFIRVIMRKAKGGKLTHSTCYVQLCVRLHAEMSTHVKTVPLQMYGAEAHEYENVKQSPWCTTNLLVKYMMFYLRTDYSWCCLIKSTQHIQGQRNWSDRSEKCLTNI